MTLIHRSDKFRAREGRLSAAENFLKAGIDSLVVIGGDGSLTLSGGSRLTVTAASGLAGATVGREGSGFLWNMVRIMVGTLVQVGLDRTQPDQIPEIIGAKDRRAAGEFHRGRAFDHQDLRSATGRVAAEDYQGGSGRGGRRFAALIIFKVQTHPGKGACPIRVCQAAFAAGLSAPFTFWRRVNAPQTIVTGSRPSAASTGTGSA